MIAEHVRRRIRRIEPRMIAAALAVAAAIAIIALITHLSGGTHRAFPHLFYVPIVGAALYFRFWGGVVVGIVAGLVAGPLMPLNVDTGQMQSTQNWVIRALSFTAVGGITGIGAHVMYRRVEQRIKLHEESILAFIKTIDAKSPYTARHSERVAHLAIGIGETMELAQREIEHLRWAALLHDVGKLWIPDEILNKNGPLAEREWQAIRQHPIDSANLVNHITEFQRYAAAARHHHERLDGRGYPDGLAGEEIPLDARIIAAADAFEAMTSDRPYRPGMTYHEAIAELQAGSGTQFDPAVVQALILALNERPSMFRAWIRDRSRSQFDDRPAGTRTA